jgi:hypothetical protein
VAVYEQKHTNGAASTSVLTLPRRVSSLAVSAAQDPGLEDGRCVERPCQLLTDREYMQTL